MKQTAFKDTLILYAEELKAAARGRFAWLGAAVVLLGIGGLAAVATQDTWLDGYGVIAYFLAPICFLPLTAGSLAGPRANRFVESVFTAPVERLNWLIAKIMVILTIALAYYLALVPMMAVYVLHVGMPVLLIKLIEWTPGILLVSVAVGSLIGVLFIGRSVAPPIATAVGIMLLFAVLVPLQELLVAQGYGAKASGHIALATPLNLLKNGLGFTLATGWIPATTSLTWLSFALVVVGSFGLTGWVFLKAQGVASWESTGMQRWILAAGVAVLVLLPPALADTNYDRAAPAANGAPAIPGVFLRGGGNLALVDPGAPQPIKCCDTLLNRDKWPSLPADTVTRQDLLVFLPVDARDTLASLDIQLKGREGLQVAVEPGTTAEILRRLEQREYTPDSEPVTASGRHIATGWVARLAISLSPTGPWDVGGVRYPLDVSATYRLAGDAQSQTLDARAAVEAHIPNALFEMAASAAVLPIICFGLAFRRWRRTR